MSSCCEFFPEARQRRREAELGEQLRMPTKHELRAQLLRAAGLDRGDHARDRPDGVGPQRAPTCVRIVGYQQLAHGRSPQPAPVLERSGTVEQPSHDERAFEVGPHGGGRDLRHLDGHGARSTSLLPLPPSPGLEPFSGSGAEGYDAVHELCQQPDGRGGIAQREREHATRHGTEKRTPPQHERRAAASSSLSAPTSGRQQGAQGCTQRTRVTVAQSKYFNKTAKNSDWVVVALIPIGRSGRRRRARFFLRVQAEDSSFNGGKRRDCRKLKSLTAAYVLLKLALTVVLARIFCTSRSEPPGATRT